jgi:hypothetical protein
MLDDHRNQVQELKSQLTALQTSVSYAEQQHDHHHHQKHDSMDEQLTPPVAERAPGEGQEESIVVSSSVHQQQQHARTNSVAFVSNDLLRMRSHDTLPLDELIIADDTSQFKTEVAY